jgi:hypothetical protein
MRSLLGRLTHKLFGSAGAREVRNLYLTEGIPDEPDTGDWDAICDGPSIEGFFGTLFQAVAGKPMPDLADVSETEDAEARVRTGWYGDRSFGAQVTVTNILESTMFDVRCRWETFGLPGMKATWQYSLAFAGQLGHVAYRHGWLQCRFESPADQARFAEVWRKVIAKEPRFAPESS